MTAKRRHGDRPTKRPAGERRPARNSNTSAAGRQTREETVGSPLTYRRLVARHSWTAAHNRLRSAKAPFQAHALHDQHAVLVVTTSKGATALGHLGSTTTEPMPAPAKQATRPAPDALDIAFARAAAESRQGRKQGARLA